MNTKYFTFALIILWAIFLSNSSGVPQAVSGAPGEANSLSCKNCHGSAGNFNPTISLEVMKPDSTLVTSYVPGENYIVRVKVKGENNPKGFGFQMVSLANNNNADLGVWSGLGDKVKQITAINRKYLVQSGSKVNGVFTSNWKAPTTDKGKVDFYFAGLATNQNGNTGGDSNVTGKFTINSPTTSSSVNIQEDKIYAYPNPVTDILTIQGENVTSVYIYNPAGTLLFRQGAETKNIDVREIPQGVFFVKFFDKNNSILKVEKFIKL